ncbi:o-succinylbenzoate--CoA ligase [Shimwellia pseudoproteus]|uniref:o-succinylbenzoate--CoA ligase n=1 Tax=Shimwellia pseudoproteus TaxID=570012 RepID=UPI0018EA3C84|nr:o-succinylbenzoate--CoA ligase [Shimwellia pseudoproteus]MBJ3814381.1 o-succinylbenzoate--CoA ligase [Shimwellia pseudoproteus]
MSFTDWPWRVWRQQRGDAIALRLAAETLTWRQLCQQVDALAAGFFAQGVESGTGVALRGKNSPQMLLCWLALLQCGARILPLNPQLPDSMLTRLLPGLSLSFGLALAETPAVPGLAPLIPQPRDGQHQADWDATRLVSMTLTSGSTGLPKAAVHSAAAHLASAAGVIRLMGFTADDSWLLSLPLFHVSGQGILWRWLQAGATLVVRPMHPLEGALQGCTHASLVPTQLWRLLENNPQSLDLKAVLLGGAAIPVALTDQAESGGICCFCGYGLTEFASTVCAKPADGKPDVGTALAGREVRIVDGEVWLRAASMAAGYWRDGKLAPLTNAEGWFATRDRGRLDQGILTIIGRLDNLFFSAGEGIQPEDVERVIIGHPAVHQVFVVPIADREFGQRPVAVVECDPDFAPGQLADWLAGKLARFQLPVHWLRLPEGLKTGGIKISRRALQTWVAQQLAG